MWPQPNLPVSSTASPAPTAPMLIAASWITLHFSLGACVWVLSAWSACPLPQLCLRNSSLPYKTQLKNYPSSEILLGPCLSASLVLPPSVFLQWQAHTLMAWPGGLVAGREVEMPSQRTIPVWLGMLFVLMSCPLFSLSVSLSPLLSQTYIPAIHVRMGAGTHTHNCPKLFFL